MVSKMVLAVASLVVLLHAATAMNHANCPYNTGCGCHAFCCSDADCQNLLGSTQFLCSSSFLCAKCGSDPSVPCPTTNATMMPTMAPTMSTTMSATMAPQAPTYTTLPPTSATVSKPPTYAPAATSGSYSGSSCGIKPVAGFCCSDADCHAQTGQKFVYCNTKYNQCNACGLYKTPKCPGGQTPVEGECPYAGFNHDGMFCCTDNDCKTALNQTYVYCNKDYFQCNACGLPGTPACPGTAPAATNGGYGGSSTGRGGYGGYGYGYGYSACSETVQQCCSDLTCQKRINNPYVFCNTTYYQCNACGNMANQACCPGNICRSGFTCESGRCIQTGYVPPAGAVVGIAIGCVAAAVAAIAGVAVALRRRSAAAKLDLSQE